jgi:hypothetical protein
MVVAEMTTPLATRLTTITHKLIASILGELVRQSKARKRRKTRRRRTPR